MSISVIITYISHNIFWFGKMKNRTLGLVYAGTDLVCSSILLVEVYSIVSDPILNEGVMMIVMPILANAPVSLVIVPWIEVMESRLEWFLLIIGIGFGCVQNYFVGWTLAWAFKHRKKKSTLVLDFVYNFCLVVGFYSFYFIWMCPATSRTIMAIARPVEDNRKIFTAVP